jgi:hypothetical protein
MEDNDSVNSEELENGSNASSLWGDDVVTDEAVLNMALVHKPFKNPHYRAPRRYRNLKQIISVEKNAVELKQEDAWKHGRVLVPGVSCT